jgi:hypothetical protein
MVDTSDTSRLLLIFKDDSAADTLDVGGKFDFRYEDIGGARGASYRLLNLEGDMSRGTVILSEDKKRTLVPNTSHVTFIKNICRLAYQKAGGDIVLARFDSIDTLTLNGGNGGGERLLYFSSFSSGIGYLVRLAVPYHFPDNYFGYKVYYQAMLWQPGISCLVGGKDFVNDNDCDSVRASGDSLGMTLVFFEKGSVVNLYFSYSTAAVKSVRYSPWPSGKKVYKIYFDVSGRKIDPKNIAGMPSGIYFRPSFGLINMK